MVKSVRLASGNPGIPAAILGPDVSELNHKPTLRVGYQLLNSLVTGRTPEVRQFPQNVMFGNLVEAQSLDVRPNVAVHKPNRHKRPAAARP